MKKFTLWIKPSSTIEQLNFLNNSYNASTSLTVTANKSNKNTKKNSKKFKTKILNTQNWRNYHCVYMEEIHQRIERNRRKKTDFSSSSYSEDLIQNNAQQQTRVFQWLR